MSRVFLGQGGCAGADGAQVVRAAVGGPFVRIHEHGPILFLGSVVAVRVVVVQEQEERFFVPLPQPGQRLVSYEAPGSSDAPLARCIRAPLRTVCVRVEAATAAVPLGQQFRADDPRRGHRKPREEHGQSFHIARNRVLVFLHAVAVRIEPAQHGYVRGQGPRGRRGRVREHRAFPSETVDRRRCFLRMAETGQSVLTNSVERNQDHIARAGFVRIGSGSAPSEQQAGQENTQQRPSSRVIWKHLPIVPCCCFSGNCPSMASSPAGCR